MPALLTFIMRNKDKGMSPYSGGMLNYEDKENTRKVTVT